MADQKITELTELTALATTDILAIVDDLGGTPITKKVTVANLFGAIAGNVVINEGGGDYDFRVESDDNANMLVVNAGDDCVGIGVADPDTTLEIYKVGTQLKLSGGAADYATFAVAADGALTITTVDVDAAAGDILLMPDGKVGIGIATPGGSLHVYTAASGQGTPIGEGNDLVVENSDHGGISILLPATKYHTLAFGTPSSNIQGRILYDEPNVLTQGANTMSFWCAATQQAYLHTDGDLYLNTVVNENAFDEYDDNMLVTGLRAMTVPDGHFLKERFGDWLEQAKPILEKTGIVNYGKDGQMFIASKKLQMLSIDAIRQLYDKIIYLEERLKALEC